MNFVKSIVENVCEHLKISPPKIIVDSSLILKSDTIACLEIITNEDIKKNCFNIHIKSGVDHFTFIFALVHELRHLYQFINNEYKLSDDYKTLDELKETYNYNLQKDEIDANAFAAIYMVDTFGIKPLFKGYDEEIKNLIKKRIDEIVEQSKKEV